MDSVFVSESEIADFKKRRQEEWEKVRTAEDPMERPEEPFISKSLYERLQEQKNKRELEYEEAHKLKNMIKGLDDDEIEFLDLIDRTKLEIDKKTEFEDEVELKDYRNRVSVLQEKSMEDRLQSEIFVNKNKNSMDNGNRQQRVLKSVIIKQNCNKKRKMAERNVNNVGHENIEKHKGNKNYITGKTSTVPSNSNDDNFSNTALKCVAILPGIGYYEDTSSDENSSDSEIESKQKKTDLLGRNIERKE